MNVVSCGMRMGAQVSFVLLQFTRLKDRRTEMPCHTARCITCGNVLKILNTQTASVFIAYICHRGCA